MENKILIMNSDEVERYFRKQLENILSLKKFEKQLENNFSDFLRKDERNNYLSILNCFYISEKDIELFQKLENDDEKISDFVHREYASLLKINNDSNVKYYVRLNAGDANPDYFVKNGTLVFKLNRVLDFNTDIHSRIKRKKDLENYVHTIGEEMSNSLQVPVKILFQDTLIPPSK